MYLLQRLLHAIPDLDTGDETLADIEDMFQVRQCESGDILGRFSALIMGSWAIFHQGTKVEMSIWMNG